MSPTVQYVLAIGLMVIGITIFLAVVGQIINLYQYITTEEAEEVGCYVCGRIANKSITQMSDDFSSCKVYNLCQNHQFWDI